MKLLRILTGVHAGAQLRLSPGEYRLGADDDADIRISDWSGADLLLALDHDGVVRAQRSHEARYGSDVHADEQSYDDDPVRDIHSREQTAARAEHKREQSAADPVAPTDAAASTAALDPADVLLIDFVPMQFDDTVICVGSPDAVWPGDVELLSTLLVKPDQARREAQSVRHRKVAGVMLGCVAVGVSIALASLLMTMQGSRAAGAHDINDLARHINEELAAQRLTELHAQAVGPNVKVTGMVGTPADDTAARQLLQRVAPGVALRQYDIAEIDARNIAESLGASGVQVTYAGQGVFDLTASVADPQALEAAIVRVRRDLDENVKTLRTHIAEAAGKALESPPFSEMVASDDVQYAQTPDGIKHIYVGPQVSASGSLAGLVPPDGAPGRDGASAQDSARTGTGVPGPLSRRAEVADIGSARAEK